MKFRSDEGRIFSLKLLAVLAFASCASMAWGGETGPRVKITQIRPDPGHSRTLTVTVASVSKTSYGYTADNRIASVAQTNLLAPPPATSRTMAYTYTKHVNGMLATATEGGPLQGSGDAVIRSFNATGDLISVSNGLGHATTYANHNDLGRPARVTSPNGAVAEYEYGARGRVVVERAFPMAVRWRSATCTAPVACWMRSRAVMATRILYHYDVARRLIQEEITEPGGGYAVKRYTYNAMSQPIKVEV